MEAYFRELSTSCDMQIYQRQFFSLLFGTVCWNHTIYWSRKMLVSTESRINSASIHTELAKIWLVLTIWQPFKVEPRKWPVLAKIDHFEYPSFKHWRGLITACVTQWLLAARTFPKEDSLSINCDFEVLVFEVLVLVFQTHSWRFQSFLLKSSGYVERFTVQIVK